MSRTASALKAARASLKRRVINHRRVVKLEILTRAWRQADQPSADLARQLQQAIDKAAGRKVLHHRTAARRTSRLMRAAVAQQPKNERTKKRKTTKHS